MNLQDFLATHNISPAVWERSNCDWDNLISIRNEYIAQVPSLMENAQFLSSVIQKIPLVHSVRWRVKNPDHLIEKIIRKRSDNSQKYADLNSYNYHIAVTDLVGIRALHLFKSDWLPIHNDLKNILDLKEDPVAYIRAGDQSDLSDAYIDAGLNVEEHEQGYRSIHYVFESKPLNRPILAELQVRTIFEEGWSEIDHSIRYPNFSDNQIVAYFLTIFNRLCGNADEMGSFVKGLKLNLDQHKSELQASKEENKRNLEEIDRLLESLEGLKKQDAESQKAIFELKKQVTQLRERDAQANRFDAFSQLINDPNLFSALALSQQTRDSMEQFSGKDYLEAAKKAINAANHINVLANVKKPPQS